MQKIKTIGKSALLLAALSAVSVQAASDKAVSGKSKLICATVNVMACTADLQCLEGQAATFDLPGFMFIEPGKKSIKAVDADGSKVNSPIKSYEVTDNVYVLQGIENHQGWTLAINRADGAMKLSITSPEANVMLAGNCTEY